MRKITGLHNALGGFLAYVRTVRVVLGACRPASDNEAVCHSRGIVSGLQFARVSGEQNKVYSIAYVRVGVTTAATDWHSRPVL